MCMWTELQVRFRVPVPAGRDLLAGLQVRRLTTGASRPGRSRSGPDDLHEESIAAQAESAWATVRMAAIEPTYQRSNLGGCVRHGFRSATSAQTRQPSLSGKRIVVRGTSPNAGAAREGRIGMRTFRILSLIGTF